MIRRVPADPCVVAMAVRIVIIHSYNKRALGHHAARAFFFVAGAGLLFNRFFSKK